MSDKSPAIDPKLVEWLKERFPNRLPPTDTSLRELDRLIGQQEVLTLLSRELDEQQDNVLST